MHMFVYGSHCVYLCLCACTVEGMNPEKKWLVRHCRRQGRLCLEIPAYMCQHYECVVCRREGVKTRQAISGHAVSVSCDSVWTRLLSCLLPTLPPVIHPAWYGVLVTATPNPQRCWEEHSIPSTDRAYWLPCQRPYHTIPLLDWQKFYSACPGCVCTANRWHLNYGCCKPAGLELTALLYRCHFTLGLLILLNTACLYEAKTNHIVLASCTLKQRGVDIAHGSLLRPLQIINSL